MKELLLLEDSTRKLYYQETETNTKADTIHLLEQAVKHLKDPEYNSFPSLTNNCDVYEVIRKLCFPEGRI